MNYYFNTTLTLDFEKAIEATTAALKEEGFGVLTEIVIVQDVGGGRVEVSAVNPLASMQAVENPELGTLAKEVTEKLKQVIARL